MGVLGLWQLLQPTARPTKLQGLEGKKLAIDISIWLHQATKGVRNSSNGHILVLYNRICKILYFKIKPIFVFDGANVPKLKQRVLKERQKKRNTAAEKAKNIEEKIQKNLLESRILKSILGTETDGVQLKNQRPTTSQVQPEENIDDIFILPENNNYYQNRDDTLDEDNKDENLKNEPGAYEYVDLEEIDPEVFESLPDDIKFDLLHEHKRRLREKKSQNFDEFPQVFTPQMKILLKKSQVANKINDLKKAIKSEYIKGTNYEDIYHEKVASETDREVFLYTKKFVNKFTAKNLLNEIHNQKNVEKNGNEDDDDENFAFDIKKEAKNEPTFRIEFNDDNKIELVPTQNIESESLKSGSIDKKYILIEENSIIDDLEQTEIEKIPKFPILAVKSVENGQSSGKQVLEESKTLDRNFESQKEESTIVSLIQKEQPITQIKNNGIIIDSKEIDDEDDDDDDFIEVQENEVDIMKEIVGLNAFEIQSEPILQISQEFSKIAPQQEKLIETVEILDESQQSIDIPDLEDYNLNLAQETNQLLKEKGLNDRLSSSIERHVIDDAKQLLRLFGLPYIESPGEAEAQCAYLDYTNQTDGSITEDSDIWLFGAKRVYKQFFGTDQLIDFYSDSVIKSQLGLDRENLINFALLVGSDYTVGVENVGIVKAVEILNEFEGNGIEKLKHFKEWHSKTKNSKQKMSKIRQTLSKLDLAENFPSEIVFNAYINPNVDKSSEEFSWSIPDLSSIRKFLINKMGWTVKKIDDDLLPIIRRLNEKNVQKTIENFFTYEKVSTFSKQSKRMKKAISLFKSKSEVSNAKQEDLNLSENDESNDELSNTNRINAKNSTKNNKNNEKDCDVILIENDKEKTSPNKRKSSDNSVPINAKKPTRNSTRRVKKK